MYQQKQKPEATNQMEPSEMALMQTPHLVAFRPGWWSTLEVKMLAGSLKRTPSSFAPQVLLVRKLFSGWAPINLLQHPASVLLRRWSHSLGSYTWKWWSGPLIYGNCQSSHCSACLLWALSGLPTCNLKTPHSRCGPATLTLNSLNSGALWVRTVVPDSTSYEVLCHGFPSLPLRMLNSTSMHHVHLNTMLPCCPLAMWQQDVNYEGHHLILVQ